MNRHYCSDCMIKHAGLALHHLTYDNQAKVYAHLHEALREAPFLCRHSLRVIRSGGCAEPAAEIEAVWLLSLGLTLRTLEAGTGKATYVAADTKNAIVAHWNERPSEGVQGCEIQQKVVSIDVGQELLRIYIGEMLSGYVETQLAMAIGVLSEHENGDKMRGFRKALVDAVVEYKSGRDTSLKMALMGVDELFR